MDIRNYSLKNYASKAKTRCDEVLTSLSNVERSFQSRMNGNSMVKIIFALIGTLLWAAGFYALFHHFGNLTTELFLLISTISIGALIFFMLIDNIVSFFHYGKINKFKNKTGSIRRHVSNCKDSIDQNQKKYESSENKNWDLSITPHSSIPEKISSIEKSAKGMTSLKNGFLKTIKNILFFANVVIFTIVSGLALFSINEEIFNWIISLELFQDAIEEGVSDKVMQIINIVALVIVGIIQIIIAKSVWSKTYCNVRGTTLLSMLFTPVALPLLIGLGTFLVFAAIALIALVAGLAGTVISLICLWSTFCGG